MAIETTTDVQLAAKLFRGFGDPTRLSILVALSEAHELRVKDLVNQLGGSQSTISGHVACLKDCGLVSDRPEGRQVFYRLSSPKVVAALRSAEELLAVSGHQVELCPNYRREA